MVGIFVSVTFDVAELMKNPSKMKLSKRTTRVSMPAVRLKLPSPERLVTMAPTLERGKQIIAQANNGEVVRSDIALFFCLYIQSANGQGTHFARQLAPPTEEFAAHRRSVRYGG